MRKLVVSMNVTLDGYLSGPMSGLDWHFESWTADMAETHARQLADADTILLGRVTYEAMAGYWSSKAIDLSASREDLVFIEMMNRYPKMIASRTLKATTWSNSCLLIGNLAKTIQKLKQQPGKEIITYGSGRLVDSLIKAGLIDEYRLWVHPIIIGKGNALFRLPEQRFRLQLAGNRTFSSGVVLLIYKTKAKKSGYNAF